MNNFLELIPKIKIVVSEVDGIITNGELLYDALASVPLKTFCMKDFEAINGIKKEFKFVFLSSSAFVSEYLSKKKNIPFYHSPRNKLDGMKKILAHYSVTPDEIMFIGSMYSDIECVKLVPLSICPDDAIAEVKERSLIHTYSFGGFGVLSEIYDGYLRPEINRRNLCL